MSDALVTQEPPKRLCRNCDHYEPSAKDPEQGHCFGEPPRAQLLPAGQDFAGRQGLIPQSFMPPVRADQRRCGRWWPRGVLPYMPSPIEEPVHE